VARPHKAGIDYFPLDVYMEQDDKIALIEAKYGIVGFGVIIKLYKKIYSENGYYYKWDDKTKLLFSKYASTEYEKVENIINDAIEWDLFNKNIFKKYQILTSKRIQKTYFSASIRKKRIEIFKELIINGVNDYINSENVVINSLKVNNNPQIKLKEIKVNKSKVKYLNNVYIYDSEYKKLIEQLGEAKTNEMIKKLDLYIGSKGDKYKSHYFTILNWLRMEKDKDENKDNKTLISKARKCYLQMNRGACGINYNKYDEQCKVCHSERSNWYD